MVLWHVTQAGNLAMELVNCVVLMACLLLVFVMEDALVPLLDDQLASLGCTLLFVCVSGQSAAMRERETNWHLE